MERLSISSYLSNGHPYKLWTYKSLGGVQNIPRIAVESSEFSIGDAGEIMHPSMIPHFAKLANFADVWRYLLLLRHGGWWCDTDTVCLRPFVGEDGFNLAWVVTQESHPDGYIGVNNAFINFPASCPPLQYLVEMCFTFDWAQMPWEAMACILMQECCDKFYIRPLPETQFNPNPWFMWYRVIETGHGGYYCPPKEAYAIHLWHEMWVRNGKDRDAAYHYDCLYERLKTKYPTGI